MGVRNKCFPEYIEENVPQKVACVTKLGQNDLEEPITFRRRTNDSDWHSHFSKLIRTHRDLPLKFNQWSREVFWQDGRSAFATKEEADIEILEILELYRRIYEEYLAIPVVKGRKSALEKIVGGLYTTSVEVFIPNIGRGIQGGAAHCLGQNFAKKFKIKFANKTKEKCLVYQNFWTFSGVSIGLMAMVHGDDKGLVLPPKVADIQIIIIPVHSEDADVEAISAACSSAVQTLEAAGFRAKYDCYENYSLGWKYTNWEMKGVPLRIEISPEGIAKNRVRIVRRDTGRKVDVFKGSLVQRVRLLLSNIHESMLNAAKVKRDACKMIVYTWDEFMTALNDKKLILAPWCDEEDVEEDVKARTDGVFGAAKIWCTPFDQPTLPEGTLCFASRKLAKKWTYWYRSC